MRRSLRLTETFVNIIFKPSEPSDTHRSHERLQFGPPVSADREMFALVVSFSQQLYVCSLIIGHLTLSWVGYRSWYQQNYVCTDNQRHIFIRENR